MHDWCRLNELLTNTALRFVPTTQKIDTATTMGRFFRDLLMLFPQREREMIAERTYEKMAEQARQGKWGGGHQVLAYDVVDKKLVVNPHEADVVRAIFRNTLNWLRSREPHGGPTFRATGPSASGIRTVVKLHPARSNEPTFSAPIQRRVCWTGSIRRCEYPGAHESIVPETQFLQVQQLLAAKRDKPRRGDRPTGHAAPGDPPLWLLRGGVHSSFVNKKAKNGQIRRYYYYKCTTKSKRGRSLPGADVRADLIDQAFVSFLRRLAQQPAKLQAVVRAAEQASRTDSGALETERNRLAKDLSASERDSSTLVNRLTTPS